MQNTTAAKRGLETLARELRQDAGGRVPRAAQHHLDRSCPLYRPVFRPDAMAAGGGRGMVRDNSGGVSLLVGNRSRFVRTGTASKVRVGRRRVRYTLGVWSPIFGSTLPVDRLARIPTSPPSSEAYRLLSLYEHEVVGQKHIA